MQQLVSFHSISYLARSRARSWWTRYLLHDLYPHQRSTFTPLRGKPRLHQVSTQTNKNPWTKELSPILPSVLLSIQQCSLQCARLCRESILDAIFPWFLAACILEHLCDFTGKNSGLYMVFGYKHFAQHREILFFWAHCLHNRDCWLNFSSHFSAMKEGARCQHRHRIAHFLGQGYHIWHKTSIRRKRTQHKPTMPFDPQEKGPTLKGDLVRVEAWGNFQNTCRDMVNSPGLQAGERSSKGSSAQAAQHASKVLSRRSSAFGIVFFFAFLWLVVPT